MNALSLLHKIRTCDKRANFTYSDTEMLAALVEFVRDAEMKAAEVAVARERCNTVNMEYGG